MSDDLLVECPIHLDAVSITDVFVFRCGHGFCEPCLEEHFAHQAQSGRLSCPTCRKPVKRREAFPLFLVPAQPSTGTTDSDRPTQESSHSRMKRELKEIKATHANCPGQFNELQREIDVLRQDVAFHKQLMQHLRGRYELLEGRLAKEAESSAREKEESDRMKEEVTKLQVESHKTSRALEDALREVQVQLERVKMFQGCIERYKHKCSLERKKRKAVENASHHLLSRQEDDSLMVVDANAPDMLHQDRPDFGWLDEACKVRGDQLSFPDDEDLVSERGSGDEVQFGEPDTHGKQREDQAPGPPLQFHSDWNLGLETLAGPSSRTTRKQKHGSKQVGGGRTVKLKIPVRTGSRNSVESPLVVDGQGRIKGTVALGSRQKFNSKN